MTNGYFKLQRRFFSHSLWEEEREFSRAEAFLDLLQLASFKLTKKIVKGVLVTLEPGQLCGSERYLSGRWNWSTKKVRRFLTLLEADNMVVIEKKREGSVITLRNYRKYAELDEHAEAQKKHRGSTEEAPRKQIEEGEERKEEEREKGASARIGRPTLSQAKSAAQNLGITPQKAEEWWNCREASEWMKGMAGGGIAPVGTNWQADLKTYATRGPNGSTPKKTGLRGADIELT